MNFADKTAVKDRQRLYFEKVLFVIDSGHRQGNKLQSHKESNLARCFGSCSGEPQSFAEKK